MKFRNTLVALGLIFVMIFSIAGAQTSTTGQKANSTKATVGKHKGADKGKKMGAVMSAHSATKSTPARDPKTGKFVKKAPPVATTGAKPGPARDPKTGRFIKKTPPVATTAAKSGPARDPKTGRFIKKTDATTAKKPGPARDPKTGKFIKKPVKKG